MTLRKSTGFRNAQASANSYPINLITGTTFSFEDGTGADGRDRIADSGSGFVTAGYEAGMYVVVAGSTSNNISATKVLAVAAGYLEIAAGSLSTEAAGDQVIIASSAGGGSWDEILRNGVIEIYSGSQPSSADSAESGTKLLRITISSGTFTPGSPTNGLNLATAVAGVSEKESAEVWSGVGLADGTAGWFRYYDNSYTTGASTTAKRVDGVCGVGTGELRLSSLTITTSATTTADTLQLTIPAE
jgi:hypothetical protein